MKEYIIKTARLGLRNWLPADHEPLYELNSDPRVMEQFPATLDREESKALWSNLKNHCDEHGYTYFAVDLLSTGEFIGLIGLKNQTYPYQYTPFVDVGWRVLPAYWGKGYATEGARACLEFAFDQLGIDKVYGVAAHSNVPSLCVMQKIGMEKIDEFVHPNMAPDDALQPCHCYLISRS